jgi:hypothetical protein
MSVKEMIKKESTIRDGITDGVIHFFILSGTAIQTLHYLSGFEWVPSNTVFALKLWR